MPFGIREAQMCALAKAAKHSDAVGLEKIQHSTDTIHPTVRKATSRSALRKHLRSSRPQNPAAWFSGASIPDVPLSNNNSLRQASLFSDQVLHQAVHAHAARAPAPPYSGGRVWSIVLCVSRGDDRALQITYVILGHCSKEFVITGYYLLLQCNNR